MFYVLIFDVFYVFMIWFMYVLLCFVIIFFVFICFVYIVLYMCLYGFCYVCFCFICKFKLYFVRFIVYVKLMLIMKFKDIYLLVSKLIYILGFDVFLRFSDSCDWYVWFLAFGWVCYGVEGILIKLVKDYCCRYIE